MGRFRFLASNGQCHHEHVQDAGFLGAMFSGLTVPIHVVDHQDFSPFCG